MSNKIQKNVFGEPLEPCSNDPLTGWFRDGNFEKAEKFYLEGLSLKPNHNGINEYLGELYVQTNRIDKANERLEVLKSCNCKEYSELELIIKTKGSKVY